jgi:rhomboid family GlyGly-CTERM serine protease
MTERRLPSWFLPAGILLFCTLFQLADWVEALRFDRKLIDAGELWRLLSANFVHLGYSHLLLNGTGLALVYLLVWQNLSTPQWLWVTTLSVLGVGCGLYWLNPQLGWYVGFSGALHGLLIAGALAEPAERRLQGLLLPGAVAAKLIWEQVAGSLPGTAEMSGGPVIVDAHLYGGIAGLLAWLVIWLWARQKAD